MTGGGKPGKPKSGFPPFPPPLEIALRFPHSHSFNDSLYIKGEVKAALLRNQQRRVGQVDLPNAPKPVALRAPQGFAPAGGRERIHQRVGPNETIERGQIKLTKAQAECWRDVRVSAAVWHRLRRPGCSMQVSPKRFFS